MSLTVLQIIPNLGAGGAEQACVDLAAALVKRGDKALVVASGGWRVKEIEEAGGVFLQMEAASKNPFKILRNAEKLAEIIRTEKVDIVHARSRAPAWSAYLACRKTGCRYMTTFHAVYKFKSWLKKRYNSVMTKGVAVIAISDFVARHVQENYAPKGRVVTVPRGIDIERFDPLKIGQQEKDRILKTWGVEAGRYLILLPGRLSPIKGQALAIEAMAALSDKAKEKALLVIVGDDQGRKGYRQKLDDAVRELEMQKNVLFVPHCAEMPLAYAVADLVLVPSYIPEGFGRVPVEAMAMGVPVIASALGATVETVVEGKTGWLLPPEDPKAWASSIEKAMQLSADTKGAMAKAGMERVRRLFAKDEMVRTTLAVYDDLLKRS